MIGGVGGIVVDLVREDDNDRTHAHKLFSARRKPGHRRLLPVVPESSVFHEGELFLGQHPARRFHRAHPCALLPVAEQGVIRAREVFGVVKLPVADARLVAIARENVGHHAFGVFIVQFWQQRHILPPLRSENLRPSAGVYGCGYTSWPSPGRRC